MRVSVSDAVEDGVFLKEQIEAADILANGQREKQKAGSDRDSAPGQGIGAAETAAERASAACGNEEEHGENADQHRQRQQPSGDQLPCRQREEIKAERATKNGIGQGRGVGRVPVKCQRRPLRLHRKAGCDGDQQRGDESNDMQELRHWKLNRPAGEENRVRIGQIGGVAVPKQEKRAEENQKGERREDGERSPFEAKGLPEDCCEAERAEPEQVNPIGDGGAAADEDQNDDGEEEINRKARTLRFACAGQSMVSGIFHPTQAKSAR